MQRGCGILLHISSLPESSGEGCFPHDCYDFIDFLSSAKVRYWQVLPLGPTDYFGSPYAPASVFAGNIDFINKNNVLEKLYKTADKTKLKIFLSDNREWLDAYADFMVKAEGGEKDFYIFSQMMFFDEWAKIRNYANGKSIQIIGDLPFYPAQDSADVYANKNLFDLDYSAGVPPDYFNEDGQLWGNPVYNFKSMSRNKYKWWISRINHAMQMYDIIRIDHFRAFDSYYKIPVGAKNAKTGVWQKGPGMKFFNELSAIVPRVTIVLEDLGEITKSVETLRDATGYPGMRVMQFGFDGDTSNMHLPVNYPQNCVAYIGTHDNDTFIGFLKSADKKTKGAVTEYLSSVNLSKEDTTRLAIEDILQSRADVVVLCMQDLLFESSVSRMNTPGTTEGNWQYKIKSADLTPELKKYLRMLIERSGRT